MSKEELVLPYKLEQHLAEICNSSDTYANLLSVWNINKKRCQEVLSTVVMNYPHYTKHNVSHCEAIITNIEMLLGEKAIRSLSPTDTWILLQAAYLHDIGMVIECKRVEENWETKEFQEYLHEMEESTDEDLAKSARFINSLGENLRKAEKVGSWPIQVRNAVTILISEYYRRQHAAMSGSYVKEMGNMFHLDLSFSGLIQDRLIQLLGDIVCLHTEPGRKILDLDYRTNGFNADYAHPRFLAQMLRMGDLLDADNNRFNLTNEFVFGTIPKSSENHWEKHKSTRHLLITPDVIEYRADCGEDEVYRETRNFLSWLKEEIEFWALNWKAIMPENINGSAPKLGKCELLLRGVPDIQGLSDLQFSISPEKAFEVIEGANIYKDKFVFLRETVQNALDACKVQLWRDLCEGRYKGWGVGPDVEELQPFNIKKEIFANYGIEIRLSNCDEKTINVVIKDNGIGLSAKQLKKICNVGVSYSGDKERKEEINSMPLWLRPTAGFGIGLQSIFLVAPKFEIYSKAAGEYCIHATVTSRRKNGYVQVSKSDKLKHQGTEIHVVVPKGVRYGIDINRISNISEYIESSYDPFSNKEDPVYYQIWDELRLIMGKTFFPTQLYFNGKLKDTIAVQQFEETEKYNSNDRYMFKVLPKNGMELWDRQTCTRVNISLDTENRINRGHYFFRGIELDASAFPYRKNGIVLNVDFYGLDTKQTLTLDRRRIRDEVEEKVWNIIESAIEFYLVEIEKTLFSNEEKKEKSEYKQIYIYWCNVSLKRKIKLLKQYNDIFKNVNVLIDVLKKGNDGIFDEGEMDFKEVIKDLKQALMVCNLDNYIEYDVEGSRIDVEAIETVLDKSNISFSTVVVDKEFISILRKAFCEQVLIIAEEKRDRCLWLRTLTVEEGKLPDVVDKSTKKNLVGNLLKKKKLLGNYILSEMTMRKFMIGIKEYEPLCTTQIPFGIMGERYYPSIGYIISPVTIKQWEDYKQLGADRLVEIISSCLEFSSLVDYAYEHQLKKGKYSKEEIRKCYKEFMREMYEICKEDEVEDGNSVALPSNNND